MKGSREADVIVVGARCAGATLGALLARGGLRVMVLDRARFPSATLSTHTMHSDSLRVLRDVGALEAIRTIGAPEISEVVCDYGDFQIVGSPPAVGGIDYGLCARRARLDAVLVEHARASGAEILSEYTVEGVLSCDEEGIAVSVRGRGRVFTLRAQLLVGADGRTSTVARAVKARVLHKQVSGWFLWFAYFEDVPARARPAYELYFHGADFFYVFPTDDGLHVVGGEFSHAEHPHLIGSGVGGFLAALRSSPPLRARLDAARMAEGPYTLYRIESYLRETVGPSWALIGDASFFKDPCTGQGMYDAFRSAELLAEIIVSERRAGRPEDVGRYARLRDDEFGSWYRFTCRAARGLPVSAERRQVLRAIASDPGLTAAYLGIQNHMTDPERFFAKDAVRALLERVA